MWSCSEFAQHLDASCAQKGLWQNHIQPQMQRIVQYSLACATVSQSHYAYTCDILSAKQVCCMVTSKLLHFRDVCSMPGKCFLSTSGLPSFLC